MALGSPAQGVRSEVGPFGCCKGSGLCSECDGDPGDCVQTGDVSSLTTGREQCVGHVLVICGCITNDPKISSLKLEFTTSRFLRSGAQCGLAGLPTQGPSRAAVGVGRPRSHLKASLGKGPLSDSLTASWQDPSSEGSAPGWLSAGRGRPWSLVT